MCRKKPRLAAMTCLLASGLSPINDGNPPSIVDSPPQATPTEVLLWERTVELPQAISMRVEFDKAILGPGAYVFISSIDGAWQRLDSVALKQWRNRSAAFNGSAVLVQVFGPPNDGSTNVLMGRAFTGLWAQKSICGEEDDRVPSIDNRVGRMITMNGEEVGICTAWSSAGEVLLSAGHCFSNTPDFVEFDVPNSDPSGMIVFSHPSHQYPVDATSIASNDGESDWAVFDVFPNSNTGLKPHEVYGVGFRLSRESPPKHTSIRVTGYGSDSSTANFINQTAVGEYDAENYVGPNNIEHEYFTDTKGGNSGGPVIWDNYGVAIGIHTTGSCLTALWFDEGNRGTSFEVDALQHALESRNGSPARFVDAGHRLRVAEDGSVYRPFDTVREGVANCPSNGTLVIVSGRYAAASGNTFTIARPMQLVAASGVVVIGE